jgi:hypothetical protein
MPTEQQTQDTENLRVEVYKRTYVPDTFQQRIDTIRDQLEALEEEGVIEAVHVEDWSKNVRVSEDDRDSHPAVERYRTFQRWAEEHGAKITPFFDEHAVGRSNVIVFPILCLTIYRDDELVAVVPCSRDDEVCTVPEYIEELERGTPPEI